MFVVCDRGGHHNRKTVVLFRQQHIANRLRPAGEPHVFSQVLARTVAVLSRVTSCRVYL